MVNNNESSALNGSQEAMSHEMVTALDIKLSAIPVDMRAIPCVALSLYSLGGASPTYILALTDASFVEAYMQMIAHHLKAVKTMYDDFMDGRLGDPDEYSQR
jgi:hypothetical protein